MDPNCPWFSAHAPQFPAPRPRQEQEKGNDMVSGRGAPMHWWNEVDKQLMMVANVDCLVCFAKLCVYVLNDFFFIVLPKNFDLM